MATIQGDTSQGDRGARRSAGEEGEAESTREAEASEAPEEQPGVRPVRRLLFATDLSPSSRIAGKVARDYALDFGAVLHVLHVSRGPVRGAEPSLEELVRELDAASMPHVQVSRSGTPAAEIVRYAGEQDIDLIIVGGHGQTGPTRALLGSVAERVSRTAPCPVLVVPRSGVARVSVPSGTTHCIVCNTPSEDLVCEPCRTRIRLLEGAAVEPSTFPPLAGSLDREGIESVLAHALLGRLGCHDGGRLYVVPMVYAYAEGALWLRSGEGQKMRMLRRSPGVCVQIDQIVHLAQWRSVLVWGRFEELHGDEASEGLSRIFQKLQGWTRNGGRPSSPLPRIDAACGHRALALGRDTIVGRVKIDELSGRFQQG
jgi:nucleotide-binding universal stress UspA family protein/nitroimidazol reductase NimA-like FMN-containing flavoprotein (pyridoxamine 5'-phosphate oxidase superfamily)